MPRHSVPARPFSVYATRLTTLLTLALLLTTTAQSVKAQTTSLEVNIEGEQVQFVAQGQPSEVSVEVYAPSGEMVFQSAAASAGQPVTWNMTNEAGEAVADGVYLATISMRVDSGKLRKRIEQIIVNREARQSAPGKSKGEAQALSAEGPTPTAIGPISGQGTIGKVAKFTGANAIGDSVITETTGKVGVNISPTSVLQINSLQPAAVAASGTNATTLLQTSGGKGGNTTVGGGKKGGAGASISLLAGQGGNAVAGSTNGSGGNITLQPGTAGTGGTGGAAGNVLVAPTAGNVGVGTNTPASKLTVTGGDIQLATAGRGIKFADGSLQTVAAVSGLPAVQHNATLTGAGTSASPLSVANLGVGNAQLAADAVTAPKIAAGQVVKSINSLEDDVTLAAGTNVTITPSGNTLTIASTVPNDSPDYIQNRTTQQPSSNFNISGNGSLGGTLTAVGAVSFAGLRTVTNATSPNVVGGYSGNTVGASAVAATIGGGGKPSFINSITSGASHATIGGGIKNTVSGGSSTIAGGNTNTASGQTATIGGGSGNTASGSISTVGGGTGNIASGAVSTVPGGSENTAGGLDSFAAGRRAQAMHTGSFVWSDSTTSSPNFFSSTAANQFLINADGGVGINTNAPSATLHVAGTGRFTGELNVTQSLSASAYKISGTPVLITPGLNNIFVGRNAGQYAGLGSNNAYFGTNAGLGSNATPSTGVSNAFFGKDAGLNNTTGGYNSFFGFETGKANTTGGGNIFIGDSTGLKNTEGNENTFVGSGAGLENLTGDRNVFIGKRAGLSNTSENDNTFVGSFSNGAAGITNATAIGANATVSQSNTVVLGNNADAAVTTQGKGVILRATDGAKCFRVTVNNAGALTTTEVTCP